MLFILGLTLCNCLLSRDNVLETGEYVNVVRVLVRVGVTKLAAWRASCNVQISP